MRELGDDQGDNARACHGLSVSLLRQNRPVEAVELSLRAVGLQHYFPAAHFQLGLILARLRWIERAAQAFETGLTMWPGALVAHRYLARLYTRLGLDAKAKIHRAIRPCIRFTLTPAIRPWIRFTLTPDRSGICA